MSGLAAPVSGDGRLIETAAFPSRHIGAQRITIWLPPGYDAGRGRYGVLYMHDGQNLFDPTRSGFGKVWAVDKAVTRLTAKRAIDPVIIVGVWNTGKDRYRTYFPQALYEDAPPPLRAEFDRLAGGPVISDAYLRFLVEELKPAIDRDYRTRPDPRRTSIMGSSMGGLISLYAIARHPNVFGNAGCVSTHWPLGDPAKVGPLDAEVAALWRRFVARELAEPRGRRIWFDHGDQTLDAAYGPYQKRIDAQLAELGWREGRDMKTKVYPGTAHEENSWAARMDEVLTWLLAKGD
ncbi:hypothetical protein D1610_02655 [Sphingomonas gilva]|uniref:Alpha/beta hydrolase n=1 Tax=Sphingomonas gilva TaxID=2305907 RepID=A0A396RSW8_9SPHN|nr:hypothetical protein D1610_02655 [Sphingomonas gilva]